MSNIIEKVDEVKSQPNQRNKRKQAKTKVISSFRFVIQNSRRFLESGLSFVIWSAKDFERIPIHTPLSKCYIYLNTLCERILRNNRRIHMGGRCQWNKWSDYQLLPHICKDRIQVRSKVQSELKLPPLTLDESYRTTSKQTLEEFKQTWEEPIRIMSRVTDHNDETTLDIKQSNHNDRSLSLSASSWPSPTTLPFKWAPTLEVSANSRATRVSSHRFILEHTILSNVPSIEILQYHEDENFYDIEDVEKYILHLIDHGKLTDLFLHEDTLRCQFIFDMPLFRSTRPQSRPMPWDLIHYRLKNKIILDRKRFDIRLNGDLPTTDTICSSC